MTTLPISSISALAPPPSIAAPKSSAASSGGAPSAAANLASQDVFLQLLVAQLKNQDPSQPTDGTQFVTELAQFSTLQENTKSTTDLNAIVAALPALTAAANAVKPPGVTPKP
jgi:flagellar basal-body rod modification protein FlgD